MNSEFGPIDSLQGFLELIERLSASWYPLSADEAWFRGAAHPLQPGAVWAGLSDELAAQHEFLARAGGMMAREPADEWELYFLLQHYGMATRLLDWTTNPFVALYFALQSAASTNSLSCPVQVWMLDPMKLNLAAVGFETVFTPGGDLTKHWLPSNLRAGRPHQFEFDGKDGLSNANPLAIYPKRRNPRILAQSGTFTIHGTDPAPVDEVMGRLAGFDRKIARIDLEVTPQLASDLLRRLASLGFSSSILFPEPEYLAKEIRAKYAQR
jgi:hypothetical protein